LEAVFGSLSTQKSLHRRPLLMFSLSLPPPLLPQRPILAPRALSPEWTPLDLPSRVMARGIYGTVSPTSLRVYLPRLPFSVSSLSVLVVLPLRFSSLSSSFYFLLS